MEKQTPAPTIKSIFYTAFAFTFSNKKKLSIAILTFTIPFLFFFPMLFVGLTVQSSFLVDFHSNYPLIDNNRESIYYRIEVGSSNTSLIPSDLFARIDQDIEEIIFYSGLGQYIQGYDFYCRLTPQYYYGDSFYNPLNIAFLQNDSFSFLTKYCTIANKIPASLNETILVHNEEYQSFFEQPIDLLSIGDNLTILPYAEESALLANNTFLINPLNVTISNSLILNNLIMNGISQNSSYLSNILNTISETQWAFGSATFLLCSVEYFFDFLYFFPKLFWTYKEIAVQFFYDFSTVQFKELKTLYANAQDMYLLSGYSTDRILYAQVSSELDTFLSNFRIELQNQWFKIASLFFPTLVFSFFILWLSFSFNKDSLVESYTNFMTRGFSRKTISRIFVFSQFTEICLSGFVALVLSFPITYLNLLVNSVFLKRTPVTLNLISFGSVILPTIIFFILLFLLAYCNLLFLYKKIEKYFPDRLSSFKSASEVSIKTTLLVSGLTLIFSSSAAALLFFLREFLLHQLLGIGFDEFVAARIILLTNTFIYIFIVIAAFSLLFLFINYLLKWLAKTASSYWKKASKKLAIILHNLSLAFQQQKRQALFIALAFLILIQSSLIPLYLSEHAFTSAKFQLGSDLAITLVNPSNTSQLLIELAASPVVHSVANYTLAQLTIFDKSYQILVLSNSSALCIFYSQALNYGVGKNELSSFLNNNNNNTILTQISDAHLNNKIYQQNSSEYINFKINNITSSEKSYIGQKMQVCGHFHIFPILLNEDQLSQTDKLLKPFLIMTAPTYQAIKAYSKDISLSEFSNAIIVKLRKDSLLQTFLSYLGSLPYQMVYRTWLDDYPDYLPSFATSIIAVSTISTIFTWILFLAMSLILIQDMLHQRQEKVLVFRYRGFSEKYITQIFLGEYLLVLLLIIPLGCLMAIGSFILLIKFSIIQPEHLIINFPHYYLITIWLFLAFLGLLGIDILIKLFYLRKSLKFQPTIMEAI